MKMEELMPEQQAVLEFHRKFSCAISDVPPVSTPEVRKLRAQLIMEEAREFIEAAGLQEGGALADGTVPLWHTREPDLVLMADALADILYVVLGAAVAFGIDLGAVFREVHRSNMSKLWPDGTVHKSAVGKVIKPPTYSPADVAGVLAAQK